MLALDVATYLVGQSIGLSFGSTGNLFAAPFPANAPQAAVSIIEYPGEESVRAFSANLAAPIAERRRFIVTARDVLDNFATLDTLAKTIHDNLDWLANTTLQPSGARYMLIRALAPPAYIGEDDDSRHEIVCNFRVFKERG